MNKTGIDIIYTTWIRSLERLAYFVVSIQSLKGQLIFYGMPHKFIVSVETEGMILHKPFKNYCNRENIEINYKFTAPSLSSGINFANSLGENPLILFMQDDFRMIQPLDINRCANLLLDNDDYYVIRFRNRDFSGAKEITPSIVELSPEMRGFYWSDNPHLKKRTYHEATGAFIDSIKDGVDQGRCENDMNAKAKKIGHTHKILSFKEEIFAHLGSGHTTLTGKTFDR